MMSFRRYVEMSKCMACLFSPALRQENELEEFAKLVELSSKEKLQAKLKFHFSKIQAQLRKQSLKYIPSFPSPITQVTPEASCLFSKVTYFRVT